MERRKRRLRSDLRKNNYAVSIYDAQRPPFPNRKNVIHIDIEGRPHCKYKTRKNTPKLVKDPLDATCLKCIEGYNAAEKRRLKKLQPKKKPGVPKGFKHQRKTSHHSHPQEPAPWQPPQNLRTLSQPPYVSLWPLPVRLTPVRPCRQPRLESARYSDKDEEFS